MIISRLDRIKAKEVLQRFHNDKTPKEVFYDLCFCICAPQTTFKSNLLVNKSLKDFRYYEQQIPEKDTARYFNWFGELCVIVKPARFYHNKTRFLIELKRKFRFIYDYISYAKAFKAPSVLLRNWIVENIKGLGMKAASHFLRNQGYEDLAVIDIHILKYFDENWINLHTLGKYNISKEARWVIVSKEGMTKKIYLELESVFRDIAKDYKLTVAELDAIIWKQRSKTEWKDFVY
jgi:N-glycosylase/DNA lyase